MNTYARISTLPNPRAGRGYLAVVYVGGRRVGSFYGRTLLFAQASAERYAEREFPTCTVVADGAGGRCGKPGVVKFTSRGGERFAECEEHAWEAKAGPDLHNEIAEEGCDRCFCGCKYWEYDRCIDCGTHVSEIRAEQARLDVLGPPREREDER